VSSEELQAKCRTAAYRRFEKAGLPAKDTFESRWHAQILLKHIKISSSEKNSFIFNI
jgi:hypothetical protein